MTRNEQKRYAKQHARWFRGQERRAYREIRQWLLRTANRYRLRLESLGGNNVESIIQDTVSESELRQALLSMYAQIGESAAKREYNLIQSRVMALKADDPIEPGFFSRLWQSRIRDIVLGPETAARITGVCDKMRERVRKVLAESTEERLTIRQTARRIKEAVLGSYNRDSKTYSRAMTIARTETTTAASVGAELGAQSTGLKLEKVWIATVDSRTRAAHWAANGQRVPKDGKFTVDGLPMKYPGDPAGGVGNCANCRCAVSYVPAKPGSVQTVDLTRPRVLSGGATMEVVEI
jgi:hypothetical protein